MGKHKTLATGVQMRTWPKTLHAPLCIYAYIYGLYDTKGCRYCLKGKPNYNKHNTIYKI